MTFRSCFGEGGYRGQVRADADQGRKIIERAAKAFRVVELRHETHVRPRQ